MDKTKQVSCLEQFEDKRITDRRSDTFATQTMTTFHCSAEPA
ncbi:hypothetical protein BURMUCGD1_4926 [Burkholderia multivorans CGD1]|nr:hypothetical protein BURMUCGD1_4926 [Burkholderia multivorans CGD1]